MDLSKASGDALKALYGTSDEIVLFWAHHEKLCVIDRKLAFMGGLDMCELLPCAADRAWSLLTQDVQASVDGIRAVGLTV
jgi:hypothetical protein